jgi:hypothetical protein
MRRHTLLKYLASCFDIKMEWFPLLMAIIGKKRSCSMSQTAWLKALPNAFLVANMDVQEPTYDGY